MAKKNIIKELILPSKQKKVKKGGPLGMGRLGFMAPELAQFAYAVITMLVILFTWTGLNNPQMLLWERFSFLSGTVALWVVYRLWPCKLMVLARIGYLLAMLSYWYPDTYEINSQFGCLDHFFAACEQDLFDCQPALLFSKNFGNMIVSELMYAGYVSYYLFFVAIIAIVAFTKYQQLERVSFIVITAFFCCYVIYLFLPVVGPQYYYSVAGMDKISQGIFPDVGNYFQNTIGTIHSPGWSGGLFYELCQIAHQAGERPTAAFPSSHVAIATLVMCIATRLKMWKYVLWLAVPYMFLCFSTVYIQAHYAIDAFAGLLFGIMLFFALGGMKLKF